MVPWLLAQQAALHWQEVEIKCASSSAPLRALVSPSRSSTIMLLLIAQRLSIIVGNIYLYYAILSPYQ